MSNIEEMDIVDFVTNICDVKLMNFQKEFLRKAYDAAKNHKQLYYIPPRGSSRFSLQFLQSLTILKLGCERGLINKEDYYSMKNLSDTITGMQSENYKERFIAEYEQTKIRYEKLKNFCNKIEVAEMTGVEAPKHDCPLALLREQQKYMGMYLSALEKRAIIENIDLQV